MDLVLILLSLLTNTPISPEAPPERTLHAMAAYVRTVSVKKGLRTAKIARALGIRPGKLDGTPGIEWASAPGTPRRLPSVAHRGLPSRRPAYT